MIARRRVTSGGAAVDVPAAARPYHPQTKRVRESLPAWYQHEGRELHLVEFHEGRE